MKINFENLFSSIDIFSHLLLFFLSSISDANRVLQKNADLFLNLENIKKRKKTNDEIVYGQLI